MKAEGSQSHTFLRLSGAGGVALATGDPFWKTLSSENGDFSASTSSRFAAFGGGEGVSDAGSANLEPLLLVDLTALGVSSSIPSLDCLIARFVGDAVLDDVRLVGDLRTLSPDAPSSSASTTLFLLTRLEDRFGSSATALPC